VGNSKIAILITLFSCMDAKRSPYTKASVLKIIEILEKVYKITINRRWVFQCVADLIDAGLISRRQRYKHHKNGTIQQLSSIIAFTLQGAKFLLQRRVEGAALLLKKIVAWAKNKDKRFPSRADLDKDAEKEMDPDEARRLDSLASKVFQPF